MNYWENIMRFGIKSAIIFLKTKIKSYGDKATDFHDKEMTKVGSIYIYLAVILTDFVLKKDEEYYQQVFSKECKHIEKEKKVIRNTTDDLEVSSDKSEGK